MRRLQDLLMMGTWCQRFETICTGLLFHLEEFQNYTRGPRKADGSILIYVGLNQSYHAAKYVPERFLANKNWKNENDLYHMCNDWMWDGPFQKGVGV